MNQAKLIKDGSSCDADSTDKTIYRVLIGETVFEIDECHGCPAAYQVAPSFSSNREGTSLTFGGDGGQRHMACHYGPKWIGYPTPVEQDNCPRIVKDKIVKE